MLNNNNSPMTDTYDKIYTVYACAVDLNMPYLASILIKNKTKRTKRIMQLARLLARLAEKQNRMDLVEELEFAGLIYG